MSTHNYLISIASIILLILAIPVGMPYGYYVLLRWIICGASAYLSFLSSNQENQYFTWTFGILAVIFNPIIPLHLGKEIWVVIDGITAVLFFISMFVIKAPKNE